MIEIRLPRSSWKFDPNKPLAPPGGFGTVFLGEDSDCKPVAVKRLHIDASGAAHRELTIADDLSKRSFEFVMPILDAGQDADSDSYYVVMPVADRSLQSHLDTNGPLEEIECVNILTQVVSGLQEANHIVHRDLKPANVLQLGGGWKISDYGIARFVEDSTSARTLKDCLSPHYAAPEQWRLDHATPQTDIYALGCVAHALLTGTPPFQGTLDRIREGHLHETPALPSKVSPQLRTLVSMMLRKSPGARPSSARVKSVLNQIPIQADKNRPARPLEQLAAAAARHEEEQSQAEAARNRQLAAEQARAALVTDAQAILREIGNELVERISSAVPNASVVRKPDAVMISVASSTLELELNLKRYSADAFPRSKWDVIAGTAIGVHQAKPQHSRSASLWFTRRNHPGAEYRWYEVGYMGNPIAGRSFNYQPAAVEADLADRAHSPAMDVVQEAYAPVSIDGEDTDAFIERWLNTLAAACNGRLAHIGGGFPHF
jgi:eukaryotic-like serine/threonine-protein kinase